MWMLVEVLEERLLAWCHHFQLPLPCILCSLPNHSDPTDVKYNKKFQESVQNSDSLFIYGLFNDFVHSSPDNMELNEKMANEYWIRMIMEGNGHGLIWLLFYFLHVGTKK
jgi:hypothetical protein